MQFVLMYRPAPNRIFPSSPEQMLKLGKLCEEMAKAGVLITSAGLQPPARGARIKSSQGKISVTDGPFTEAKEVIAGFNLIQVKSKEEAIEKNRQAVHPDRR